MKSETSYFLIGLFVTAGIIVFTGGVIAISSGSAKENVVPCYTLVTESVAGLSKGAAVRFRGVQVGEVERVDIARRVFPETENDYILVEFFVSPSQGDTRTMEERKAFLEGQVKEGIRLRIASNLISGVQYLNADVVEDAGEITPLDRDWLKPGEKEKRFYIPWSPSKLSNVFEDLSDIAKNLKNADIAGLVGEAKGMLQSITKKVEDLNVNRLEENVNGLITDARTLVVDINGESKKLSADAADALKAIGDAARAGERLLSDEKIQDILAGTKDITRNVNDLLTSPKIQDILTNLEGATAEATTAILAIKNAVKPAERLLVDARHFIKGNNRTVEGVLLNLEQLTQHLNNLSRLLEKYPSYAIFGTPPEKRKPGQ